MRRILHIWVILAAGVIITSGIYAQTPASLSPTPNLQFFDTSTGVALPLVGGLVYTYAAGTLNPLATYVDSTLTTQNSNPIVLNSAGYNSTGNGNAGIWLGPSCYKIVLQNSMGVTIYTQDQVCNQEGLLQAALAKSNGSSLVGFEQPGGVPITVAAALNNSYYGSEFATAQVALNACPTNGSVVLSGTYTASNLSIPSNCHVVIPPGSTIKKGSNAPVFNLSGVSNSSIDGWVGGVIDGQFSQSAYASDCIDVAGAINFQITGLTVQNCGSYGVFFNGASNINQHTKVLNSTFTNNQADALYSQGLFYDWEWAGNNADGSTNATNTHTFGVHYGQSGTNPPHGGKIHDNDLKCGPNWCIEVGSFFSTSQSGWPYDIHLSRNSCLIVIANSGCESLSLVRDFSIESDVIDANNTIFFTSPETIATNGSIHGEVQKNCNTSQTASYVMNQASDVDVSGSSFCGSTFISVSGPGVGISDLPMNGLRYHDNSITLQPGYTAAVLAGGGQPAPIWVQLNDANSKMHSLYIHDNIMTGNSTSDGTIGILLEDDPCTSSANIDQVLIHHNTMNAIQYGLGNLTNCANITNVSYTDNILGSGTSQFYTNFSFGSLIANNYGLQQTTLGMTPTCTNGIATNGTGTGSCTNVMGSYFSGYVQVTASGSPASAPNSIFSLGVPAGTFGQAISCLAGQVQNSADVVPVAQTTTGSATNIIFNTTTTTLIAGHTYYFKFNCN
jgi:hypothetical protein